MGWTGHRGLLLESEDHGKIVAHPDAALRGVIEQHQRTIDVVRAPNGSSLNPGYALYEGVFEQSEMAEASAELDTAVVGRSKAGARHVLGLPVVRRIATDSRLVTMAHEFVGPAAVPFRATLFAKSAKANWLVVWHQDTALPLRHRLDDAAWGPWSIKAGVLYAHAPAWALERVVALRVSLDDSTLANGPLRVLPGTHTRGVLTDAEIERLAAQSAPVDCLVPAGGVVAMRPLTLHASSKAVNDEPRRVLHLEYASATDLGAGVPLAVG